MGKERKCPHCGGPIVEREVPVLSKQLAGGNRVETGEVVRLPVCQACGLVVMEVEDGEKHKNNA